METGNSLQPLETRAKSMEGKTSMCRVVDTRMFMLPFLNHARVKWDPQKKKQQLHLGNGTLYSVDPGPGTRDQGPEDLGTWGPGDPGPGTQIGMHCRVASSLSEYPGPHMLRAWVCVSNCSTGI